MTFEPGRPTKPLRMYQRADFSQTILMSKNGVPFDFTTRELFCEARKHPSDDVPLFSLSSEDVATDRGIFLYDGSFRLFLGKEYTKSIEACLAQIDIYMRDRNVTPETFDRIIMGTILISAATTKIPDIGEPK